MRRHDIYFVESVSFSYNVSAVFAVKCALN